VSQTKETLTKIIVDYFHGLFSKLNIVFIELIIFSGYCQLKQFFLLNQSIFWVFYITNCNQFIDFPYLVISLIGIVGSESDCGDLLKIGRQSPEARVGERLVHREPGAAHHVAAVRSDT
jgi:hypothetical protein